MARTPCRPAALAAACLLSSAATAALAQDWPQWRGPAGDAKAADFKSPAAWPKELAKKWKVPVGEGVATPALVGDKLFVFARQDGEEVTRCLDAATGKELWQDKYPSQGATGPAAGFSGPRASPAVVDGKVVTVGVRGMLSCLDAATGKKLWRKDDFGGATPRFQVSASPLVAGGLVVAQLGGGGGNGGIVAYDLATGEQRWKWAGEGPDYASPSLMTVDGVKLVVAETEKKVVAVTLADGKLVWETPFAAQGMGAYNAASPVVDGQTIVYSGGGRGTKAVRLEKAGDAYVAKELWSNADKAVQFSSPVVKDGLLYGLSGGNELFCLDAKTGKTLWAAPIAAGGGGMGGPGGGGPGGNGGPGGGRPGGGGGGGFGGQPGDRPGGPGAGPGGPGGAPGGGGPGGRRGGRGMGGGGGRGGYGSIVDAGDVLLVLTPASDLIAFKPSDKQFTEVAKTKVAASPTYAYPVVSGSRVFVKDQDSVSLLAVE
jgi:outer membrane protein assembly factor BamB